MTKYLPCTLDQVRSGVRWDVPARNAGQAVEVAYATSRHYSTCADDGDEYKRVTDRSGMHETNVYYYRREDVAPLAWASVKIETGKAPVIAAVFGTRESARSHAEIRNGQRGGESFYVYEYRQVTADFTPGDTLSR